MVCQAHPIAICLHFLVTAKSAAALREAEAALSLLATLPEPAPATLARSQGVQGRALLALRREAEAQPLLEAALAGMEARPPDNREELAAVRRALGRDAEAAALPAPTAGTTGRLVHGMSRP
jgi:hypothetical protein